MKVSVIIPVYRDYPRLRLTLDALLEQDYEHEFEVIVADNGTPVDELEEVEREAGPEAGPGIRWVREPSNGSYAARNAALSVATGEFLAFTDADCIPTSTWLSAGVANLRDTTVGLVGGHIELVPADPNGLTPAEIWELERGFPQKHYAEDLHFAATANAFTRKEVFTAVGPFHETLLSGGDREFGERVHDHGYRVVFTPDAVVQHPTRDRLDQLMRKTVRTTRGDLQRQQLRGELQPLRRLSRGAEAAWRLATPAVTALRAAAAYDGPDGRLTYAAVETLVRTRKEWEVLRWLLSKP